MKHEDMKHAHEEEELRLLASQEELEDQASDQEDQEGSRR
jgi:hypothetical protein